VQLPTPPIYVAAVRTEETYRWAGANGFDLLTAPFFFPDHTEQQHLLSIYRDSLRAHGHDPAQKQIMAVYHMYCAESDAEVAEIADPALRRYQTFTKATDLSRQAYRDPVAYKDWKGFFENRETITLEQMKATRAVVGRAEECVEKVRMLTERFGITQLCFEVNFGALPHERVMASMRRCEASIERLLKVVRPAVWNPLTGSGTASRAARTTGRPRNASHCSSATVSCSKGRRVTSRMPPSVISRSPLRKRRTSPFATRTFCTSSGMTGWSNRPAFSRLSRILLSQAAWSSVR